MKNITKTLTALVAGSAALTTSLPVLAHSEHGSALSGIIHFMTEPDHLAISGLVAAVVIFAVRRMGKKRV